MRVVGIDPGLAHMGVVVFDAYRTNTGVSLRLVGQPVLIVTKPETKKGRIRRSDDNLRRARLVARTLWPLLNGAALVCYEAQSFGMKGQVAARQAATAFGILAALAEVSGASILAVSPQEIKKATCPGIEKAQKDDVCRAIENRIERWSWPSKNPKLWEHPADAAGAVLACLDDELFRAALRAEADAA